MWKLLEYCSPFFIAFTKIQALEILSEEFHIILQRMSPTCQGPEGPLMALWSLYVPVPSPRPGASSSPWAVSPCRCAPAAPFSPAAMGTPSQPTQAGGQLCQGCGLSLSPRSAVWGCSHGCTWLPCSWLGCGMSPGSWALPNAMGTVCALLPFPGEQQPWLAPWHLSLQWGFLWSTCRPFPIGSLGQSMVPITSVPWVQSLRGPFSQ